MPAWPPRVGLPAACQASNSSDDMRTPSEKSCAGRRGAALHTQLFFLTVLVAACAGSMRRFPDTIKAGSQRASAGECRFRLTLTLSTLRLRGGLDVAQDDADWDGGATAADVAKAAALLQKARAGYAASGVQPPDAVEQIDALNAVLEEDRSALIRGDAAALDRLQRSLGPSADDPAAAGEASVVESEEDGEDWEGGVEKMQQERDAILHEMRTGVPRSAPGAPPGYSQWDEIPALRKAELMMSEDSHHPLWKAVRDGNADRLRYLLDTRTRSGDATSGGEGSSGAGPRYDINHKFPSLWNSALLHVAAEGDDIEVATLLVEAGADLEQRNTYLQAPLHLASYWGETSMVRHLVDMGADVEVRSSDSSTPLHIAAFYGQNATAQALVALGGSLTSVNSHGQNALQLAEMGKWEELAAWLRCRMGMPPAPEGQEPTHVAAFEQLKEEAIERLAHAMEKKLFSSANGSLSAGAEGPLPHVDVRAGIRAAVEDQARMEATLALETKLRKGHGAQGAAIAAAAAAVSQSRQHS